MKYADIDAELAKLDLQATGSSSSETLPATAVSAPSSKLINVFLFNVNPSSITSPPTLDRSDPLSFERWKAQFKNFCLMTGTSQLVFDTTVLSMKKAHEFLQPFGFTKDQIKSKYLDLHARMYGALASAIEPAVGSSIINSIETEQLQKPGEFINLNVNHLWEKVRSTFEKTTGFAILSVFRDLINLHYNSDENPLQFKQRFDSLLLQLNRAKDEIKSGEKMSEGMKLAIVIRALPKKYDSIIQSLLAGTQLPTIDQVIIAVQRHHDATASRSSSAQTGGEVANAMQDQRNTRKNKKGEKRQHYKNNNQKKGDTRTLNGESAAPGGTEVTFMFTDAESHNEPSEMYSDYDGNSDPDSMNESESDVAYSSVANPNENRGSEFLLDSAASRHLVFNRNILKKMRNVDPFHMQSALKSYVQVKQMGMVRLNSNAVLNNVCYVPKASANLMSLSQLLDGGATVQFTAREAVVKKEDVELKFVRKPGSGIWAYRIANWLRQPPDTGLPSLQQSKYAPPRRLERKPIENTQDQDQLKAKSVPTSSTSATQDARQRLQNARVTRSKQQHAAAICDKDHAYSLVDVPSPTFPAETKAQTASLIQEAVPDAVSLWHARFGHQSQRVLASANEMFKLGIPKHKLAHLSTCICDACIAGKGRRTQIGTQSNPKWKAKEILDCLHMDLIGPVSVMNGKGKDRLPSLGGNLYSLQMTDEFSRAVIVELLPFKSAATDRIITTIKQLQTTTGRTLKRIRCDGGGEFINSELRDFLASNGTELTYSTANTPQHNPIAERMNGKLQEMSRAMLSHAKAPMNLWGEAILYAAFVYNSTPQTVIQGKIPFEVLYGRAYNLNKLRVFGCDAYIHLDESKRGKFEERFKSCVFVGTDKARNAFRVLDVETKRILVSQDVKFNEGSFTGCAALKRDAPAEVSPIVIISPPSATDSTSFNSRTTLDTDSFSSQGSAPQTQTLPTTSQSVPTDYHTPLVEFDEATVATDPIDASDEKLDNVLTPSTITSTDRQMSDSVPNLVSIESTSTSSTHSVDRTIHNPTQTVSSGIDRVRIAIAEPTRTRSGRVSQPTQTHRFYAIEESGSEPNTYKQAIKRADAQKWQEAMKEEIEALNRQGTWSLVKLPAGAKAIKSRWVYKIKLDSDNKPVRHKARIVAKGFQQQYGIDYNETFAPVVKIKSLKMLLSLAAQLNLELKQLDFDTAFLNATLTEDVYMEQPEGFHNGDPNMVCKLHKALYGLKQAPHEWNRDLNQFLIQLGYQQLQCDTCVYVKRTHSNRMIILCVYVDDTVVAYDQLDEAIWMNDKKQIAKQYSIKDIGDCQWILNMKVERDRDASTIVLCQQAYIERVLKQFNMNECKIATNPEMVADLFTPPKGSDTTPLCPEQQSIYRSIIGSLSYAAITTRIDIAHVVNELSRYNNAATQFHFKAAKHVLRYLSGTTILGLVFKSSNENPFEPKAEIFVDANWGTNTENRRSTSGLVAKLNGNIICWTSKKQPTVALSSTEAEYVALTEATTEAIWMKTWIREVFRINTQAQIYCDNQSAIALSKNDTYHQRTKHIDIKYHFIRERVKSGDIQIHWIPTQQQQADLLTKMLPTKQFLVLRELLMTTA